LAKQITKPESSESSSSDEYTYEDDSEGDFQPVKEGTPITTITQAKREQMTTNVPMTQEKTRTEEKRRIPIIRTVKKEKSPTKTKETVETYYFPYDRETKVYQFMPFEDIPTTREDFRNKNIPAIAPCATCDRIRRKTFAAIPLKGRGRFPF